eukprot:TRINITY_DN9425_c0_g1_i1.p3 TRINITY_DN9425_c0_g1~~TRINITY_DN9425_c0_g1_i1.p3  ORF type:complete len:116 (+),score=5.84 TRINITY_DN9425_c0_g1_i1:136-483(+)
MDVVVEEVGADVDVVAEVEREATTNTLPKLEPLLKVKLLKPVINPITNRTNKALVVEEEAVAVDADKDAVKDVEVVDKDVVETLTDVAKDEEEADAVLTLTLPTPVISLILVHSN